MPPLVLVARLCAQQVYKIQWMSIGLSALLVCLSGFLTKILEPITGSIFGTFNVYVPQTPLGPIINEAIVFTVLAILRFLLPFVLTGIPYFFLVPALMKLVNPKVAENEAMQIIESAYLRENIPANTPADLLDQFRGIVTREGLPFSSIITPNDFIINEFEKRTKWWLLAALSLSIALSSYLHLLPIILIILVVFLRAEGLRRSLTNKWAAARNKTLIMVKNNRFPNTAWFLLLGTACLIFLGLSFSFWTLFSLAEIAIIAFIKWIQDTAPIKLRAIELETNEAAEVITHIAAGGLKYARIAENARTQQITNAINDAKDGPPLVLGTSTGIFKARGDLYAPTEDLPVGLSLTDIREHIVITGATGKGKTSGVLRPLIEQAAQCDVGLLILDGKASLPGDLSHIPGMCIIDPELTVLCPIKDLEPTVIIEILVDILDTGENKTDQFFSESAKILLRSAAIIAHAAGPRTYTLANIGKIASDEVYRQSIIDIVPPENVSYSLIEAQEFFTHKWKSPNDDKTSSGILAQANSWMEVLNAHEHLIAWNKTSPEEDSVDFKSLLTGGRFGILIPEYRYGRAGAVISALLKARLYKWIKERAEGWGDPQKPVLIIMDECQELLTKEDSTMLAMGRSLGLGVVAATQTIEGVQEKLGEETTQKFLSIFSSVIALSNRSPATDKFVAERAGQSWRSVISSTEGISVQDTIESDAVKGYRVAARYQPSLSKVQLTSLRKPPAGLLELIFHILLPNLAQQSRIGEQTKRESKNELQPLIYAEELTNLLAEPNTAIALLTRARVPRRDLIKLNPIYD